MKMMIVSLILCFFVTVQAGDCECTYTWQGLSYGCHECPRGCWRQEISWDFDECFYCPDGTYQPSNNNPSNAGSCQPLRTCYSPGQYIDNNNQGSVTTQRQCLSCPTGTESSSNNQLSCSIDINGCEENNGNTLCSAVDSGATCTDVPAPGTPNPYTCQCSFGYEFLGGECVDPNPCNATTCKTSGDTGAVCVDLVSPAVGHTCTCSSGYTFVGTDCVDVDECANNNPCDDFGDTSGTCSDNHPPEDGYTCTCGIGYESKVVGNVRSCHDINACENNLCAADGNTDATCYDAAAPSLTYTCGCTYGYTFDANALKCVDTNDCEGDPCNSGGDTDATCTDMPPGSNTRIACTCSAGYEFTNSTCVDINRCASNPCIGVDTAAECFDAAAPEDSYSCTCSSDRFRFDGTTCVDNDFCVSDEPCRQDGDLNSTCLDAPWDANITHTCANCSSGFTLTNDLSLCAMNAKPASKFPINFDDGTAQAVIGGAVFLLIVLIVIVCWYRRRVKKSIARSEKVLRRAEMELSSSNATRDFDDMELGGGVVYDLDSTATSDEVKALEKAKSRLELENAALRKDNQKHKQKLEKQSLSKTDSGDELKRSDAKKPEGFASEQQNTTSIQWSNDMVVDDNL